MYNINKPLRKGYEIKTKLGGRAKCPIASAGTIQNKYN